MQIASVVFDSLAMTITGLTRSSLQREEKEGAASGAFTGKKASLFKTAFFLYDVHTPPIRE
jgi:hypothetical protein